MGAARERVQGESERSRDPIYGGPARIGDATLEAADQGDVQLGGVGQALLGHADLFATQADRTSERGLGRLTDAHTRNPRPGRRW